ncbi:MarR family winged helix-turn-helix transcriptional regulator [Sphingomonas sp. LT1P40]|uniref:MarR family winged helix-turn-helix transcriptional regulator n=1 Tax=Alteristakelama amylovorans TaxID=3096166 RepID=UPI002FC83266
MDEHDAIGAIADRIGYQLRRVDVLSMNRLHETLETMGVRQGRATAIAYISRHPGCDQTELGGFLGINRASTMSAVNALVTLGLVERRPGRDRRSNALHLTQSGHLLHDEIVRVTDDHDEDFFGVLSASERADLMRLLQKLRTEHRATAPRTGPTTRAVLRRVK